jgi:inner membrane transporter RhtA
LTEVARRPGAGAEQPGRSTGFSPEALFVLSGVIQNVGSILAKSLFGEVEPATVAWIRVSFAAIVLLTITRRQWWPRTAGRRRDADGTHRPWTRADFAASAIFGVSIALMNLFFYLAIDRLDLGKGLTLEFIGPITVAATRRRTKRNGIAVALAVVGVCLLSGVEIGGANRLGLVFIFCASAMWATYIVVGSRVARQERGLAGLGVGLMFGAVVLAPFGAPSSGAVFTAPRLLILCCLVGLLNSVFAYSIDQHVMRRIPTHRFALLLALLPVSASFIAFIALDEQPTLIDIIGIAFVLAGVIYQQRDTPPSILDELHE